MKKFVTLLVCCLMISGTSLFAQQNQSQKKQKRTELTSEQKMDLQVKRMTKELMLDDSQTAKFTPVYINYLTSMQSLAAEKKMNKPTTDLTDAQEIQNMKESFSKRRKMIDIQEKYFNDFSKFLTAGQLQRIFKPAKPMMKGPKGQMSKRMEKRPMQGNRPMNANKQIPANN